jgi:hypothetical protein
VGNIVGPLILDQVIGMTVVFNMPGLKEARAEFFNAT